MLVPINSSSRRVMLEIIPGLHCPKSWLPAIQQISQCDEFEHFVVNGDENRLKMGLPGGKGVMWYDKQNNLRCTFLSSGGAEVLTK